MRHSPLRHPLAVLRLTIGYTQKQMADLCGRKMPTIQAVELGKLTLSAELANRIAIETGVSEKWLWANDVNAEILTNEGKQFTREFFDCFRGRLEYGPFEDDYKLAAYMLASLTARIADCLLEAKRKGELRPLSYRLEKATASVVSESSAEHRHYDSWINYLHSHGASTLQDAKQTANATIKKILDDFWQDLDSQFQKKKDHGSAVSLKTVPKQLLARKTPRASHP